jgi:hypothetical protein
METNKMNKLLTPILMILAFLAFGLIGCDNDDTIVIDTDPVPTTPQGVFSVTGDGAVYVYFNGIYEHDVDHYVVYRSLSAATGYAERGDVDAEANPNLDLVVYEFIDNSVVNGVTYFYAVTAVDHASQESELSAEDVFDTPRPAGTGVVLPYDIDSTAAGFSLAAGQTVDAASLAADFWVDRVVDTIGIGDYVVYPYLNAAMTDILVDIQDMGYTEDFDEISYAPSDGWSQLGYVEAIEGHTYIVWTEPDNYAKVRITSITPLGTISFTWGYQTDEDNLELAPPVRPERDRNQPAPKPGKTTQLLK